MIKHLTFPNIESTKQLEFEELSSENYFQLENIFKNDTSPFVSDEYKSLEGAENYYKTYQRLRSLSPRMGNCDWFFKLKDTGEYIGLINLYDLIFDKSSKYHQMCSAGCAISKKYRGRGLTKEASQALIKYIFSIQNISCITANTQNENIASISLMKSLGFSLNTEDHTDDLKNKYFELRKS